MEKKGYRREEAKEEDHFIDQFYKPKIKEESKYDRKKKKQTQTYVHSKINCNLDASTIIRGGNYTCTNLTTIM